jgi:hypothetical protein
MSVTDPSDQLLVALVGKEKSGKSRLAATAPKPVLFFDHDGRARSLAGRKGVYACSYVDQTGSLQPDAFSNFISHLTEFETHGCDIGYLGIKGVEPGTVAKTIVLDSIQTMATNAMRYLKFTGGKAMARTISVGGMQISFPAGFDAWNAEMATIEDTLLRVFAMGKHTIVTLHEVAEEAPESTIEHPVFTGKVSVFPVRYQRLLRYFNEVWRVTRDISRDGTAQGAIPNVSLVPTYNFALGATTLNVNADEFPNIEAMLQKHRTTGPTASSAQQVQAAPQMQQISAIPGVVMSQPTTAQQTEETKPKQLTTKEK